MNFTEKFNTQANSLNEKKQLSKRDYIEMKDNLTKIAGPGGELSKIFQVAMNAYDTFSDEMGGLKKPNGAKDARKIVDLIDDYERIIMEAIKGSK